MTKNQVQKFSGNLGNPKWRHSGGDVRSGKLEELLDGMAGDGGTVRDCRELVNKNH